MSASWMPRAFGSEGLDQVSGQCGLARAGRTGRRPVVYVKVFAHEAAHVCWQKVALVEENLLEGLSPVAGQVAVDAFDGGVDVGQYAVGGAVRSPGCPEAPERVLAQ